MNEEFFLEDSYSGQRLDIFLSERLNRFSRSKIQKLIKDGCVLINDKTVKPSYVLMSGDKISIHVIETDVFRGLKFIGIDLDIVFEDDYLLIVNKPPGLVVHPTIDLVNEKPTLVNAILNKLSGDFIDNLRPGIVHRLDQDTSGLIIIAKTPEAQASIIELFKNKLIEKHYLTLVKGKPDTDTGFIEGNIGRNPKNRKKMAVLSDGGKFAKTYFKVKESFFAGGSKEVSLLDVKLLTGRTHQIRVHLATIKHPVIGDSVYGDRNFNKYYHDNFGLNRQFLHAYFLKFTHPFTKKEIVISIPLYNDLDNVLNSIR